MYSSEATLEQMKGIAIVVFKTCEPSALPALKKFLTVLRSPRSISNVLLEAIEAVIEEDPEAGRWLLSQHSLLLPELNLMVVAQQLTLKLLQERGWVQNQDFSFGEDGRLQASDAIKFDLIAAASLPDRLLLEILL